MWSIIFIVFVQFLNVLIAENNICSRIEVSNRTSYETYRATMAIMAPEPNCATNCKKVKHVYTYIAGHNVTKAVTSLKLSCCSGYERDSTYFALVCKPKCSKVCVHGVCKDPEKCVCYKGYTLDPTNEYNCLPHCNIPCEMNSTCVAPNKCQCDTGYKFNKGSCEPVCSTPCIDSICIAPDRCQNDCTDGCDHGTCIGHRCVCNRGWIMSDNKSSQPICSNTCVNSTCVEPENCQCTKGYVKSSTYSCKPYCSGGCPHGNCVAPETCVCDSGWQMVQSPSSKTKSCQPICSKPCVNGTCVAPEICECLPGYEKSQNNICVPYCSDACQNGKCVSPNTCVCNPGWEITPAYGSMNETCSPVCSKPCVNGTCVAPDTCECLDGFVESEKNVCEPHCAGGCQNGACLSPETCICNPGWYKSNLNGTCVTDNTSTDKSKGVDNTGSSAWVYVLVMLIIVVLMAALVYYFKRVRRYRTLEDDGTMILPTQEVNTSTLLYRHGCSYDVTKNSEL